MVYAWADWLADAFRTDPFVAARLILEDGWKRRGRPPPQFSFLPSGIVDHHTACMLNVGHDPRTCINGIIAGRDSAPGPISQMLGTFTPPGVKWNGGNVDPRIVVMAAGRSNHPGVGEYPWGAPSGAGSSLGIEWCGPPANGWPDIVVELRARVDACILRYNGWGVHQLTIHWEYARPLGRKIDQSGPWHRQPNLSRLQHWDPDVWRDEVSRYMTITPPPAPPAPTPTPPPAPTPQPTPGDDMTTSIIRAADNLPADQDFAAWFIGQVDSRGVGHVIEWTGDGGDPAVQERLRAMGDAPHVRVGLGSLRHLVLLGSPPPDGTDTKHTWRDSDFAKVIR